MTNLAVASTILAQLGGNKFLAMTGAKHLLGSPKALSFQLPSAAKAKGVKYVSITLDPSDTYTVMFSDKNGLPINTHADVYCDSLQELFTAQTGLYTHL
jgi:hypothetical protein